MTEKRVLLDAATFLDSPAALAITGADTGAIREVVQRFLGSAYADLGKAPRLLDGDELLLVLGELLPRRFGARDPLGPPADEVLRTYLSWLWEHEIVPHEFEQRRAIDDGLQQLTATVAAGAVHADGLHTSGKPTTVVHRTAKKGRNDPCFCGSGKKFKKCCMRLGS